MEKIDIDIQVSALLQCQENINVLYQETFGSPIPLESNFDLLKKYVIDRESLLNSILVAMPQTPAEKQLEINKILLNIISDDTKIIDSVSKEQANVKNELAGMLNKNKKINIYKNNAAKVK